MRNEAPSLLHWAGYVLGQPSVGIQVLHPAITRLALSLEPLQSIPLQGVVVPWQSGCCSRIPTASKKAQAGFATQSSVTPFAGQYSAKRHKEERAEIKVFLVPASSCPFWSRVYRQKQNSSSFPCSPGKSRRQTVKGEQFFAFLVGPESQLD